MTMAGEVTKIRQQGLLTACQAAQMLGIGPTTLYRLEGRAYDAVARSGGRNIRVFRLEEIESIKAWLRSHTSLGKQPALLSLEAVARLAGCSRQLLRTRLGKELPRGHKLAAGTRGRLGFSRREVTRMVKWVKDRGQQVSSDRE